MFKLATNGGYVNNEDSKLIYLLKKVALVALMNAFL